MGYDPNEPRDDKGMWTSGGGGVGTAQHKAAKATGDATTDKAIKPVGRLIGPVYKTYEGAHKRAGFERGVAPSEFRSGAKAHLYNYSVVPHTTGPGYRVVRTRHPQS